MAEVSAPIPAQTPIKEEARKKGGTSTFSRVARYTIIRILSLTVTVLIGLYLTILIANMGGYVDTIRLAQIREDVNQRMASDPAVRKLNEEQRTKLRDETIQNYVRRYGMDKPFIVRSFAFLKDAVTLNLGRALNMTSNSGSNQVRLIILERLPPTLLLFATSDIILFITALMAALLLSRHYGSFFDKIIVALTPLSSAPGWFYGIFLILLFASVLRVLPFGGMVDSPPPPTAWGTFLAC